AMAATLSSSGHRLPSSICVKNARLKPHSRAHAAALFRALRRAVKSARPKGPGSPGESLRVRGMSQLLHEAPSTARRKLIIIEQSTEQGLTSVAGRYNNSDGRAQTSHRSCPSAGVESTTPAPLD